MGGHGSGRYYRQQRKNTVDGCKRLDVNWLNRNDYLVPGQRSTVSWTCGGEASGDIVLRAESLRVLLEYRFRCPGGDWEDVVEHVGLAWTPCTYGGERPWFICPGAGCGRRVGSLYARAEYFLCRHCYNLAYSCQKESAHDRSLRTVRNIRRRLGASENVMAPFPRKPKGMHWRTYSRLRNKHYEAECRCWSALETWLHKMAKRLPSE